VYAVISLAMWRARRPAGRDAGMLCAMGPRTFPRALRLLTTALILGTLFSAAALPAAALAGLVAVEVTTSFTMLPSDLQTPPTAQVSFVYANDGRTLLTTFYDENRTEVALSQVATVMQQAIVAAEDSRFYEHGGVDLRAVVRSLVADVLGRRIEQGASTLTMQYVRNVLKEDPNLTPQQRLAATADTPARKLQEMRYAMALETRLSKPEILDRYLNIAYFGAGAYGISAASRTYFGEPPSQLTLAQSALLAGLVQSPDTDNLIGGDRNAALARRTYVLQAMAKAAMISPAQAARAASEPLTVRPHQNRNGCVESTHATQGWGFFCDYLRQWWDTQPEFGATPQDRDRALHDGGYTIITSLDPSVQTVALRQSLAVYGYQSRRVLPMAAVQPGTGRVLALAVNRHYSLAANPAGQVDRPNTVNQLIAGGGSATGYAAGSTFKLFTMLAALADGLPLDTPFDAPSPLVTRWSASGPGSCRGHYCPVNDNPGWMDGRRTMWDGFGRSVNTYFVWLEQQIGPDRAVAMARRLGITFRAPSDEAIAQSSASDWGSFTLGVADTTPLDLASAYATIAADGRYCRPLPVLSITDSTGRRLPADEPQCDGAVDPDVAHAAVDAARCPVGQQSVFGRCNGGTARVVSAILGGRPVAGKTGSSENNATETFVGVTPQIAVAATAADPDAPHDYVGAGVSSLVDAAVARTMSVALGDDPWLDFPAPSTAIAFGVPAQRTYR